MAFRDGRVPILTSCDLVSEGFDLPAIEVAIALRPTQSLGLWLQQVGRALRPCEGKTHALLLDHAGNTLRHGLPTDPVEWSLADGLTVNSKKRPSIRICGHCFAASPPRAAECVNCGRPFPIAPREVQTRAGELAEVTRSFRIPQGALEYPGRSDRRGQASRLQGPLALGAACDGGENGEEETGMSSSP